MRYAAQRILFFSLFLLCTGALCASGKADAAPACSEGLSAGAVTALKQREGTIKYTRVIKTDYFDIIYPAQSERTATVLASRIDALYEKAAAEFETDPWMRHFPVIISPSTQVFNAYYTSTPYNHIVLLDTPNTSATLAVETETIVNTFYHELIHAVTANIHKNSIDNRPNLFGDFYSLQFLVNSKLFTIEGATVSRESGDGEGRINSGEAMSMVIQAGLEDSFPSWEDIAGPRDIYPSQSASYIFGGAFSWWLQETYGMSMYADFWKECSTVDLLGFQHIFRKVYGMSLDDAWALFELSVPVPETEDEGNRTILEDDARFASLAVRPGRSTGIVYTKNACSVRYLSFNDPGETKDRELFSCYGSPNQLSFSDDGRYLAVSGYMTGSSEAFSVRVYDMEAGRFTGAEVPYSRNAVITEGSDGIQYLYCVESAANYEFATLYLLDDVLNASDSVPAPVSRTELSIFDELYDTAPVRGGAACLRKTDGIWYVTVSCVDGTSESWRLPDNAVPTGLSSAAPDVSDGNGMITLYTAITSKSMNAGSESEPGALARLGVISIKDGNAELSYQKCAFSGGVHKPAVSQRGTVYAISAFYEYDGLCCFHSSDTCMTEPVSLVNEVPEPVAGNQTSAGVAFRSENYKPLSYMKRGVLYPLADIIMSPFSASTLTNQVGLTWWTETPDEKVNVELSFAIPVSGLPMEIYATVFSKQKRITGETLMWDLNGTILFDEQNKLESLYGKILLAEQVPLSNSGNQLTLLNGLTFVDSSFNPGTDVRYIMADTVSAQFVHQKKKGMNPLATEGIKFGVHLFYQYDILSSYTRDVKSGMLKYDEETYASPGVSAGFNLARLLPLPYMPKLTINWPVSVSASLWDDPGTFVTADASVTLFSAEIQKGIAFVPFFCNRFTVNAGWSFRNGAPEGYQFSSSWLIFHTEDFIRDFSSLNTVNALTAGMNFVLSPDIANMYSGHFNVGVNGKYYIRNDNSDKQYEISVLGVLKF